MIEKHSVCVRSPLGSIAISGTEKGVECIRFEDRKELEAERAGCPVGVRECAEQLQAYFSGDITAFASLRIAIIGTAFQSRVWEEAMEVPCGETVSYGDFAERLGNRDAARAVGSALARNPLAIVVPCHRIVLEGGLFGGYAWGSWRKEWLLRHEQEGGRL